MAVVGKIQASKQVLFLSTPAVRNIGPIGFGNLQPAKNSFVRQRPVEQLETHAVDLFRRRLEILFNLAQIEAVVCAVFPLCDPNSIAILVPMLNGQFLQVRKSGDADSLHVEERCVVPIGGSVTPRKLAVSFCLHPS